MPFLLSAAYPTEREWQEANAIRYNAIAEERQWDDSRVDLLNDTHSIEIDWADKWPEAVGQSLYYAIMTGKKPGIILLVKDERWKDDRRFLYRAQIVCAKHGIDLWVEMVGQEPESNEITQ